MIAFTNTLNQNLRGRGKPTVEIDPADIKFVAAQVSRAPRPAESSAPLLAQAGKNSPPVLSSSEQAEFSEFASAPKKAAFAETSGRDPNNMFLVTLLVVVGVFALYLVLVKRKSSRQDSKQQTVTAGEVDDRQRELSPTPTLTRYQSKVTGWPEGGELAWSS
jgi:hypothetical protein